MARLRVLGNWMIDFRYHLVSIVAIFLALAVGIVLGSGPLKDDISGFLEDRTEQLAAQKLELQDEVSALRAEAAASDEFADLVQPAVVSDVLDGHVVTLITLPRASDDETTQLVSAIEQAGGRVGEQVDIKPGWFDPDQLDLLSRVAADVTKGDREGDPYALASEALAEALLVPSGRAVGEPLVGSGAEILGALENDELDMISVDEQEIIRGDSAIVVGSADPMPDSELALVPLFTALDEVGGGTVVAGPVGSAEPDGVVEILRSSDADGTVSSVDRLDGAGGVTATVLTLAEQLAGGIGHYGSGPDADGPGPDPVPRG